jgi:phospholipid/cholesterol/gamma-HCH transport system substrate-binding protein
MKATPQQKIKIGVFTLVGILIVVIAIFLIGNRKNMFTTTFGVYAIFKNVGGLQVGNNVRFSGINVGTVDGIQIITDSTVRVDLNLQSKVKPFLKKNATAAIGSDGLMGDKLVTISGSADTSGNSGPIAKGDRLTSVDPVDFGKVMNKVTAVVDNASIMMDNLAGITGKINAGKGSLGKLLNSDTLSKSLIGTLNSIKKSSEGFSQNMEALHHNFLLKGYFKKKDKEKAKQQAEEAAQQAQQNPTPPPGKGKH